MGNEPIISVSGLRGIVGETLTPDVARRYAAAFAETLPDGPIIVARDGRANGAELVPAVVEGLSHGGLHKVLDAGIAATPTTGILVRQLGCAGGIQITASHNPAEYNGLKLFNREGRVVPVAEGQRVLDLYRAGPAAAADRRAPQSEPIRDPTSAHLALIEDICDVARIRTRGIRVVLDANHGSGGLLGRAMLEHIGCEVKLIGEKPDGRFAHPPEPTAENLATVSAQVPEADANVGFCQDPDADRLAIIDEQGRYLGEEYTLAICADHILRQTPGPVVMNCSTSRMTEDVARKYRAEFHRSAVGEANVVDKMISCDAIIGGEGNGGVIDPRVGMVRDSFVGMALVLNAMATRLVPVSKLADELPRYAIRKTKMQLSGDLLPKAFTALERGFVKARIDRLDGLRMDWGNPDGSGSWLLVRASNTEPIVRLIAEAPTADGAQRLCDEAMRMIREVI
jgi:phosphomannomutase